MVSITLSVPTQVKQRMDSFPEINWSGFIRGAIKERTEELVWKLKTLKKLEQDKEFENWCVEMGRKVNEDMGKRLHKEGLL